MKILLLLGLLVPATAFAACPTNHAGSGPYEWFNGNPVWDEGIVCGHVTVNLPAGIVQLSGGGGVGEQTCGASLSVSDVYQLVGPASATPFSFTARVHLSGEVPAQWFPDPFLPFHCHSTSVVSDLTVGGATDHFTDNSFGFDSQSCSGHPVSADRSFPLSKLPGEAFTISLQSSVSGYMAATIRQTLTFDGLPAGYTIQSCQGFSAQPTPAFARSWGAVKASYR
jgi:hypothetical protein